MPHKIYDCCDSNRCECGKWEKDMTNYGDILDNYREDTEAERKRAEKAKREKERKRVDKEFEKHVLNADVKPKKSGKTCSANSDLVKYAKHLKAMQKALQAAEADGFCLDEIMDGLKELHDTKQT